MNRLLMVLAGEPGVQIAMFIIIRIAVFAALFVFIPGEIKVRREERMKVPLTEEEKIEMAKKHRLQQGQMESKRAVVRQSPIFKQLQAEREQGSVNPSTLQQYEETLNKIGLRRAQ